MNFKLSSFVWFIECCFVKQNDVLKATEQVLAENCFKKTPQNFSEQQSFSFTERQMTGFRFLKQCPSVLSRLRKLKNFSFFQFQLVKYTFFSISENLQTAVLPKISFVFENDNLLFCFQTKTTRLKLVIFSALNKRKRNVQCRFKKWCPSQTVSDIHLYGRSLRRRLQTLCISNKHIEKLYVVAEVALFGSNPECGIFMNIRACFLCAVKVYIFF